MSREWILETVISHEAEGTPLGLPLYVWGHWNLKSYGAPHGSCQRPSSVLWAEEAQEESRMGMVGRKDPKAKDRLQLSQ